MEAAAESLVPVSKLLRFCHVGFFLLLEFLSMYTSLAFHRTSSLVGVAENKDFYNGIHAGSLLQ